MTVAAVELDNKKKTQLCFFFTKVKQENEKKNKENLPIIGITKCGKRTRMSVKEEVETSRNLERVKRLFVRQSTGVSTAHCQNLARARTHTTHTNIQSAQRRRTPHSLSPAFFSRLNLQFFKSQPHISHRYDWGSFSQHTAADSRASCGKCASPRGPCLSYATLCKSAAITQQQEPQQ